jgi:chromosome segregation protein
LYLKALELFGFKTFAERTRLQFGPGVTAIVGPNGSGKSNIADAILFVLGEQSSKSIRTNQVADVIFNGTERRKPLGLGEVTLVLDNADAALDVPYQEVAVTRRTHRDGESDYFINKTRCRLRDIQDLFLDTGLGKETYSMIGQSDVERLLSLRPEDRRAMFEEAAGTAKYRGRRNEALRRLEGVQGNLTRIHDIHVEVEQQLEPLRKQAEKAREYRVVAEELRELSVGILAAEALRANDVIGRCEHEAFIVRADLERFETEAAQLEMRAGEWREKRDQVEAQLEEARRLNGRIQGDISRTESDIAVGRERLQSCETQTGILLREMDSLGEQRTALAERIALLAAQHEEAAERLDRTRPLEEERRETFTDISRQIEELSNSIAEAGRKQREEMQQRATLESNVLSLRAQRRDLDTRLRETDQTVTQIAGQEASEQSKAAHLDEELLTLEDAEAQAADAVEAARKHVDAERRALEARIEARTQAQGRVAEVDARLASIEEIERAGGHLPRGVQSALRGRSDGVLDGIVGTVAEVIGVPPEYERAISAALGEWSRALVVETRESAWSAVRWLQSEKSGYALMLPADTSAPTARSASVASALTGDGVVGRAPDLISFHPKRADLVERLLGATVIVRDLNAAHAAVPRLGTGGSVVTLSGERWDADGAIGGGSELSAAEDPISLVTAREDLNRRREDAAAELERVEEEIPEARAAIERAKEAVVEAERAYQECLAGIQQAGTRAAVAQERLRSLRARREQLEAERNELTVVLGDLDRKVATATLELEAVVDPAEPDPTFVEETLSELGRQRDAARDALSEATLAIREAAEQLRTLDADLASLPKQLEQIDRRQEQIRGDLRGLREAARSEAERMAQGQESLDNARREGQAVLEQLKELSDQRLGILHSIDEADRLGRDARSQVPDLRAALSAHEVRRARAEEHRSTIQQRLAEEFGLALPEAEARAVPAERLTTSQERLRSLRSRLGQMGEVNTGAEAEHERLAERERFLATQRTDLETSRDNLREIIAEIDAATKVQFLQAFNTIADQFQRIFRFFFAGGQTQLVLTDPDNILETGVEVSVKPPGRAKQNLLSLSGGERAITAISLLFAMLRVRPSPFCVLDEIDAPLDEANTERFSQLLHRFTDQTQFLVITHAPGTMQGSDRLYGVTMQEKGVSCCLSIALEDAEDVIEGRSTGKRARDVLYAGRDGEDLEEQ